MRTSNNHLFTGTRSTASVPKDGRSIPFRHVNFEQRELS